ncbi:MAG: restriction endonuclease [Sarcina sp.]
MDIESLIFLGGIGLFCLIMLGLSEKASRESKKFREKLNQPRQIFRQVAKENIITLDEDFSIFEISQKVKFNFTPRQFEQFSAYMFEALGYNVKLTPAINDGGKDLILNDHIVVECKKFITQQVGREICQKLLGAMVQCKADKAIVINTGEYNYNARMIEKEVEGLTLLGLNDITKILSKIGIEKSNEIFKKVK